MSEPRSVSSSDLVTTSTIVSAKPCTLTGLYVQSNGSNTGTVIIYDNDTTNSGTILAKGQVTATAGITSFQSFAPAGIKADYGLYAALTTTGAVIVYFK